MGHKLRHKFNTTIIILIALLIAIAAIVFAAVRIRGAAGASDSTAAIRNSLRNAAMHCYVIEGSYPESIEYLKENYGLAVNTDDYDVIYIAYAENLMPEIKVVPKAKK